MRVTITGATGLVGARLVARLRERGDEVTVLSRDPERARSVLGEVDVAAWDPTATAAASGTLAGRDAVVHLAGEPVAQRWSDMVKERIWTSREAGTRCLVAGLRQAGALAKMLPPFRAGIGGPVAGGRQYMPWIHLDDLVGIYLAALDGDDWSGPVNASAPEPVT